MVLRALLLALALAAAGTVAAQDYPGRLLFADTAPVPPFPYRAEADSARARFARYAEAAYAEGAVCVLPVDAASSVVYTAILDDGREVSLREYQPFIRSAMPEGASCFVTLRVEWNGTISEARVMRCRGGEIPDETLVPLVRRLRAEVTEYGFGDFPVRWSLPFPFPDRRAP